jgi:hypothetical protein
MKEHVLNERLSAKGKNGNWLGIYVENRKKPLSESTKNPCPPTDLETGF